ncbi:MAG: MAPEG family protein [Saccharospirillaceae bacterium]|nr:MAPEG family protein [Pseudomonadales bacterium]NRB80112.1 MAPEG family protein [Saccharospirillaceae bacterium]
METATQIVSIMSPEIYALLYMGVILMVLGLAPFLAKLIQNDFLSFYKHRELVKIEGWGVRAEKSVKNLYESLPLFIVLALIIQFQEINTVITAIGVLVFCVSRTLHPIAYILNIPPVRTLSYVGGIVGMVLMSTVFF